MKNGKHLHLILRAFSHYISIFMLFAFVITCCMTLFLNVLSAKLGVEFSSDNIALAAKLTFWNVILISFIFTILDTVRRKLTVDRPVKRISEAAEKMIQGDFTVRVPTVSRVVSDDKFNDIIDCINKMAEELASIETLRTDFIANVSHEMKTPLAVMQNYGTLLQSPTLSDEKRIEYAKAISDASRRLADMMTNILKLNRLENQKIYPVAKKYNLSEQLCECLLQFENVWESRNINIDTDIEENVFIFADEELFSLVWNNLISNALKFTDENGEVSISLSSDEEYATVTVKDTGCGIHSEVGAHIFEKFYQGDSSRATQGNGLGLALVKRVIDITQSEIGVESTLGIGSVFTVRIRRSHNGLKTDL